MADKFDISQHIKVETLGTREGNVLGSSLFVNGKEYPVASYSTTPIVNPLIEIQVDNKYNSLAITWGTELNDWTDGTFQYPVNHPSGTATYELWVIERTENTFIGTEDPASLGTVRSSWSRTKITGTDTRSLGTLNPGTKWYMFGVYYISGGNKILVGKAVASRYLTAAYTYAFTGSIGDLGSNATWRAQNYTTDLVAIRSARQTYIVPKDPSNTNVATNYALYFNDTLAATFTLSSPTQYWNPASSSDATWTWNVGVNTLKLFLATDNPATATPRAQLTVNYGYTENYAYPTYETPVRILQRTSNSMTLRWDLDETHIGQVSYPANIWADTYINVYGSDGSEHFYYAPVASADDAPIVNSGDRVWQAVLTGLNPTSSSYLVQVFYMNESTSTKVLWDTVTYGPTPPAAPTEGDPVFATGWWPIECSVSSVEINMGFDEEKAMLRRPEVGTCSLTMKGDEADPRVNTALQLDNKVRVLLAQEASPTTTEDYLFSGFIDVLSTTYDTLGNSITSLGAVDAMSRVLNVTIPTYEYANPESFSVRMFNVFEDYIAPATSGISYDDSVYLVFDEYDRSVFPPEFRENVSSSEIINELTEGEFAIMAQNRGGVIFWFNRSVPALIYAANEGLLEEPNWYGFSTEHSSTSTDHFCISDFTISNRMEDITNKVTATLTYDELTSYTYTDAGSIGQYGTRAYDVQLNLHAPAGDVTQYLQRWTEEVPYSEDRSELESLTTNVVNRHGFVTKAYQLDVLADPVRVFIQTGPVDINGIWFARRIRHSITPETWTMQLELTSN